MKQISYKLILAGESGVGKSTFVYRYINGKFKDDFKRTIGVDFYIKNNINIDGTDIKLQIWDLGGEEKFRSFLRGYIRNSSGVLFLFDLNDINSLNQIGEWMGIVRAENKDTPILLVGAKSDLLIKREEKQLQFIQTMKDFYNFFDYIETSSKLDTNINEAFNIMTNRLYYNIKIVPD